MVLWNATQKIVRQQEFKVYQHNIIAYTVAWLLHITSNQMDLEKIWNNQMVSSAVTDSLEKMCRLVNEHIRSTEQDINEYCKSEQCWCELLAKEFVLPENLRS